MNAKLRNILEYFFRHLQVKVILILFVSCLVISGLNAANSYHHSKNIFNAQKIKEQQAIVDVVAQLLIEDLLFRDYLNIDVIINNLYNDPELNIISIEVENEDLTKISAIIPDYAVNQDYLSTINRSIKVDANFEDSIGFIKVVFNNYKIHEQLLTEFWLQLSNAIAIALILSIILMAFLKRLVLNPLHYLNRSVHKLGNNDFGQEIHWPTRDELGALADTLNDTRQRIRLLLEDVSHQNTALNHANKIAKERAAEAAKACQKLQMTNEELTGLYQQLRHQNQVIQASKVAAASQLAASVAHELSNPMTAIVAHTSILDKRIDKIPDDILNKYTPNLKKQFEHIVLAANKGQAITENLQAFARQDVDKKEWVNVSEILSQAVRLAAVQFKSKNITIHLDIQDDADTMAVVVGSSSKLERALVGLLLYIHTRLLEFSSLDIKLRHSNHQISICIVDRENILRKTEFLENLKPSFAKFTEGELIDLFTTHSIIQNHSGNIDIKSDAMGNTLIEITLPCVIREHNVTSQLYKG